jgi:glycosyltransferase involved in cell wall biosynthesis
MRPILFVSHDSSRTGAVLLLLQFLTWLKRHDTIPFQILLGKIGPLAPNFAALARTDLFEPTSLFYRAQRRFNIHALQFDIHQKRLLRRLEREKFGAIYMNTAAAARMLQPLLRLDCPVISHIHELEGVIQLIGKSEVDNLIARSRVVIAASLAVRINLETNHKVASDRIAVVDSFIPTDTPIPTGSREGVLAELGIRHGARLVIGCGSIEPRKGTDLFLDVARATIERRPDRAIHFIWVGGRPEMVNSMRKNVQASALQGLVHFIGPRADVYPYLSAGDVFLMTSREDPFPLVMLEAGLCSKPLLCFDGSGGPPAFVRNDGGFIIPPFEVETMAKHVLNLVDDPYLQARLGSAARARVLALYSLDRGSARLAGQIRSVAQSIP